MNWIIILAIVGITAFAAFWLSGWFRNLMSDSETILWARLQMVLGAAATALTYVDPSILSGIMPAEWLPWVVLANGVATEFLRRSRASDV